MVFYKCDLCDQIRECVQKKIEGKYYEICLECWSPLEAKLKGKGRPPGKEPFDVMLPPPAGVRDPDEDEEPFPGAPPKIWMRSNVVQ